jgi:hypothetical protein
MKRAWKSLLYCRLGVAIAALASACSAGTVRLDPQGGSTLGRCKRGFTYGGQVQQPLSDADLEVLRPGVSWWYTWSAAPPSPRIGQSAAARGLDFVPMVFTAGSAPAPALPEAATHVLGFNEPNFTAQANLTPQEAAAAWPAVEAAARARGARIVSPAMNYCKGTCTEEDPFAWLDAFFAACTGCQVDAIAVHAYVCSTQTLTDAYLLPFARYGKPLWITEIACLDGPGDPTQAATQEAYMRAAVPLLEQDPRVERYAWFIGRSNTPSPPLGLLGADGELTPLGETYVSLPASCAP